MRARWSGVFRWAAACVVGAVVLWGSRGRADETFNAWKQTARYEFEYRVDAKPLLEADAEPARLWIPLPSEGVAQKVLSITIESPWPTRETRDRLGNRMLYLEPKPGALAQGSDVVVRVVVQRLPHVGIPSLAAKPETALAPKLYLHPARRIPLNDVIRRISQQESEGKRSDAEKIRAFYDYVVRNMTYSKKGKGWGQGDALWACTAKYGNCTDFHSLFIGLARAQAIPARFVIGFPMPADRQGGEIPGYHCWAEVFDPGRGWLPLDSSEAKKSGLTDAYFGRLPSDRIAFTVGRDLRLEPAQEGELLNYFIYPYAELGGQVAPRPPAKFQFRRLHTEMARRSGRAQSKRSR